MDKNNVLETALLVNVIPETLEFTVKAGFIKAFKENDIEFFDFLKLSKEKQKQVSEMEYKEANEADISFVIEILEIEKKNPKRYNLIVKNLKKEFTYNHFMDVLIWAYGELPD